jgi:O-antigen/teichoic acid export membrane protein
MVSNQMRTALDRIIVGKWVGISQVGVYGLAAQLLEYIMTVIIQGMNVLTPRFANLAGTNNRDEIRKIFKTSIRISAFMAFGFCLGALIFGEKLIVLWVGTEFIEAKYILWILTIGFAFDLAQNPGISLMFALNKHYLYASMIVVEAIAKIAISLLLVSKYGMVGVALGTALPMLVTRTLVQPVYVSRLLGMNLLEYGKPIVVQMIIAALIVGTVYYFNMMEPRGHTIADLIGSMVVVSLIYGAASVSVMEKDQKKIVFDRVLNIFKKNAEPNI